MPTFLFVLPPLPPQEGTVKFIRLVKQTNKKKKNFIINIRLLCRWEFHKWLMNISKGKHKGGRYEAGSFFRNIEFIVITQEHGETLIYGLVCPWPHSLGSLVLLSCKYVSLGFFFSFRNPSNSLQVFLRLYISPFPWSLSSTFMLLPKHLEWLLCTQLIKWMVHSLRQSFLLLSDIATYIFY